MPKIPYSKAQFNPKEDFSVMAKDGKDWKPLEPGEGGAAEIARNLSDVVDKETVNNTDYLIFTHTTDGRKFRQKLPEKVKKIHEDGFEAAEESEAAKEHKTPSKSKPKKPSEGQQGQQGQQGTGQDDVLFSSQGQNAKPKQASSKDHIYRRVAFLISGT